MAYLLSLLFVDITQSAVNQQYIHCYDTVGLSSSSSDSEVGCSPPYTVTSCGVLTETVTDAHCVGSSFTMENSKCRAFGDRSSGSCQAYARCCNLTDYGNSFHYYFNSNESLSVSDATVTQTCVSPTEKAIGCFGYDAEYTILDTELTRFDGLYAGSPRGALPDGYPDQPQPTYETCTAQNGDQNNDGGVYIGAVCYDESTIVDGYELECISLWGDELETSTVACPVDANQWFMTSCMGHSYWAVSSYYIENNVCIAKSVIASNGGNANAICCRMFQTTSEPTYVTYDPTVGPSYDPTTEPTIEPTTEPTIEPTIEATTDPTLKPTTDPTVDPTDYPTSPPSQDPTSAPINNPTNNPSDNSILIIIPTSSPQSESPTSPTLISSVLVTVIQSTTDTTSSSGGILIVVIVILCVFVIAVASVNCYMMKRKGWMTTTKSLKEMQSEIVSPPAAKPPGGVLHDGNIIDEMVQTQGSVDDTNINIKSDEFIVVGDDETCK